MRVAFGASLFPFLDLCPSIAQAPPTGGSDNPGASARRLLPPQPLQRSRLRVDDSDIGLSYNLPSDWEFVVPPPAPKVTVPFP
jgi:hypothetical protein